MVDFRKMLSPETRARLAHFDKDVAEHRAMRDEELAETTAYYLHNCERSRWREGDLVYDGVVWHVILPELLRRLAKAEAMGERERGKLVECYLVRCAAKDKAKVEEVPTCRPDCAHYVDPCAGAEGCVERGDPCHYEPSKKGGS
jgi:hypothetical protein